MTPLKIQRELKRKSVTQKQIAESLGKSEMSVSDVIRRRAVSDAIMRAISAAIDKDHRIVFPEYYGKPPARSTSKAA